MMNASLRQLEFHDAVRKQVRMLDKLFRVHAGTELFDNPDIEFYVPGCTEHVLRFLLARLGTNSVQLEFHLQPDGMRVDIEGYPETWEAAIDRIKKQESEIMSVLERLIASPILIEYKGGAKFINLFNQDGSKYAIWGLQSISALALGGYWKPQSIEQHLFDPIYCGIEK